jgi:hypothetical protein
MACSTRFSPKGRMRRARRAEVLQLKYFAREQRAGSQALRSAEDRAAFALLRLTTHMALDQKRALKAGRLTVKPRPVPERPHSDQTMGHPSSGDISAHRGSPCQLGQDGDCAEMAL